MSVVLTIVLYVFTFIIFVHTRLRSYMLRQEMSSCPIRDCDSGVKINKNWILCLLKLANLLNPMNQLHTYVEMNIDVSSFAYYTLWNGLFVSLVEHFTFWNGLICVPFAHYTLLEWINMSPFVHYTLWNGLICVPFAHDTL